MTEFYKTGLTKAVYVNPILIKMIMIITKWVNLLKKS